MGRIALKNEAQLYALRTNGYETVHNVLQFFSFFHFIYNFDRIVIEFCLIRLD
uniref:Uncharacterized protein n=1 Tax=Ascaris lumbricoides TaxID=6252 RepID=A0A0M3HJP2_ASCLU